MINKESFLSELADKKTPADMSRQALLQLKQHGQVFEALDDNQFKTKKPYSYDEEYFNLQYGKINKINFSLERIEHLLEVKETLQKEQHKNFEVKVATIEKTTNRFQQTQQRDAFFKPSERLRKAILDKNINKVRAELELELGDDTLELSDVLQSGLYSSEAITGLFEEHMVTNRTPKISETPTDWNKNYYFKQVIFFRDNFSIERFLHLLNVKQYLREQGVPNFQKIKRQTPHNSTTSNGRTPKGRSEECFYKKALIIGGAVLAAILAIFGRFR